MAMIKLYEIPALTVLITHDGSAFIFALSGHDTLLFSHEIAYITTLS